MKTANGQQVVFSLDLHYIQVKDLDQIHCLGFLDLSKFVSKYVAFSVFAASIQNKIQKKFFFCDKIQFKIKIFDKFNLKFDSKRWNSI